MLLPIGLHSVAWQTIVFSVLALTALRMIPVALASFGIGERSAAVALVGWLRPRGLASIVFALLVVEQLPAGAADPIVRVITLTVGISVLVHGLTAGPLAGWTRGGCRLPDQISHLDPRTRRTRGPGADEGDRTASPMSPSSGHH